MSLIQQETDANGGSFFYLQDDKRMAEMTYSNSGDHKITIDHTEVDKSLEGKGVGKMLLERLIAYVRENNIKVVPVCPFANIMFKRHTEWQDVLS